MASEKKPRSKQKKVKLPERVQSRAERNARSYLDMYVDSTRTGGSIAPVNRRIAEVPDVVRRSHRIADEVLRGKIAVLSDVLKENLTSAEREKVREALRRLEH